MSDSSCSNTNTDPGMFCWRELITRDAKGSTDFYTDLLSWKSASREMPDGSTYTTFNVPGQDGDSGVAGMMQVTEEMGDTPSFWLPYITVENIEESVAKAEKLGAGICKGATDIGMGIFAVLKDPQGASFGLWQFKE